MKIFYSLLIFAIVPFISSAQCSVITTGQNASCFGSANGVAIATPNGVASFSYLWSPGGQTTALINGLTAGTYVVTMTDGTGCSATSTVVITSPPAFTTTITSVAPSCGSCCNGSATVIVSGGNPPYTYQWSPSGGTGGTAQNLCPGNYAVCVTDASGCSTCNSGNCSFCQTSVTLSPATGIANDPMDYGQLSVYPTRVNQFVTLDESFETATNVEISIVDLLGQTIYTNSLESTIKLHNIVDMSGFPDGLYLVSVKTNSGIQVRKIIKDQR
jgi:hypothetical protein